jgi:hypothetical protein
VLKWVFGATTILVAALWLFSGLITKMWVWRVHEKALISVEDGDLSFGWGSESLLSSFIAATQAFPRDDVRWVNSPLPVYGTSGSPPARFVVVPLWLSLAAALVLTSVLWLADRRPAPGHCQHCGYDLTGNVSGRCPECGEATNEEPA